MRTRASGLFSRTERVCSFVESILRDKILSLFKNNRNKMFLCLSSPCLYIQFKAQSEDAPSLSRRKQHSTCFSVELRAAWCLPWAHFHLSTILTNPLQSAVRNKPQCRIPTTLFPAVTVCREQDQGAAGHCNATWCNTVQQPGTFWKGRCCLGSGCSVQRVPDLLFCHL